MNIECTPEDANLVTSQFALMERVSRDARIHFIAAEEIPCEACRASEQRFAADCVALVELCSMLMTMHLTTVASIQKPRPDSRFIKVG